MWRQRFSAAPSVRPHTDICEQAAVRNINALPRRRLGTLETRAPPLAALPIHGTKAASPRRQLISTKVARRPRSTPILNITPPESDC